jgi:hypothetical protein
LGSHERGAGEVRNLGLVDVNLFGSGNRAGGLAGENFIGSITNCYSTGTVSGDRAVGGLVGSNGFLYLKPDKITSSYSSCSVSGNLYVGGLVGDNWGGTVTRCFWDTETSSQATSAGGTGKTTAEMQTVTTFLEAGWDFVDETANGTEDIWWINEGQDYPRLWWETQ